MKRLITAAVAALLLALPIQTVYAQQAARPDIVEVVEITGEINDFTAKQLAKQIEAVNENPKVKAVLLIVDTPGGGAIASAATYEELARIKVPVVGWCSNVCASGGMYILMSPAVKLIAVRSEAIAGSIGVIMQSTRYNRLLEWAKIDSETYKSGSLKDAGNPARSVTEDEKRYLQSIVDDLAERFYDVVEKARPAIDAKQFADIKTARIFIGSSAVKAGLADEVMTRDQAIDKAKALSGSKLIFTREEMKKMSSAADAPAIRYSAPVLGTLDSRLAKLMDLVEEIHAGESVRFSYRMPYSF